jgi:hypothetical protein
VKRSIPRIAIAQAVKELLSVEADARSALGPDPRADSQFHETFNAAQEIRGVTSTLRRDRLVGATNAIQRRSTAGAGLPALDNDVG